MSTGITTKFKAVCFSEPYMRSYLKALVDDLVTVERLVVEEAQIVIFRCKTSKDELWKVGADREATEVLVPLKLSSM
jgi:hypothetical protein